MQVLYGPDNCDAIGRAYRSGLLGEGSEAKNLLDTARKVSRAYWQAYATGTVRSCIGEKNFGTVISIDHERVRQQEEWLHEVLDCVNRMGRNVRRSFDQLVIDIHPDNGPKWLDALLQDAQQPQDNLREALDALSAIAD
jgi:hypothetical protein